MILDRVLAQVKGTGNRLIAHPLANQREDLMLTWSQGLSLGARCGQAVTAPALTPFPIDEEAERLSTCRDRVAHAQRGVAPTGMTRGDGPAHNRRVVHLERPASDEPAGCFVLDRRHRRVEVPLHAESASVLGEVDVPMEGPVRMHTPPGRRGNEVDEPIGQGRQGLHTGKCGTGIEGR